MERREKVDIYIKPVEKVQIVQKRNVLMKDVAELFIDGKAKSEAENLSVFHIPPDEKKTYLITVLDLIQILRREYTDAVVNNVGEKDILIEYLPRAEGRRALWTMLKVVFVSAVLFVGAATTIMCFHTDVQLPLIFQNIYYIFYGENKEMSALLSIPYSIGLGLGIIIFFNHFFN